MVNMKKGRLIMKKFQKAGSLIITAALVSTLVLGCSSKSDTGKSDSTKEGQKTEQSKKDGGKDKTKLLVAAASSLEYSYKDELIPMFEKANPDIEVEGTYDSSGKLQTQIEEGIGADIFMSAAMKQMNTLVDENLVDKDSVVKLLENKIVLITAKDSPLGLKNFKDITKAKTIAIGDPDSVPVGQYSKEALTNLGLWNEVSAKASLGTNVTEVLNWVAEGSADAGIVYATDAATTDKVKVVAEAPAGSLAENAIYPVGIVSASKHKDAAKKFVDFLQSDKAIAVFEKYGFIQNKEK